MDIENKANSTEKGLEGGSLGRQIAEDIVNKLFSGVSSIQIYKDAIYFDKKTGIFRIGKKSAKFSKKSKHYKLIHILWENRRIVEYPELAMSLWGEPKNTSETKRKIHQVVYEIKEKLGFTETDQEIFFCNDGYMLQGALRE